MASPAEARPRLAFKPRIPRLLSNRASGCFLRTTLASVRFFFFFFPPSLFHLLRICLAPRRAGKMWNIWVLFSTLTQDTLDRVLERRRACEWTCYWHRVKCSPSCYCSCPSEQDSGHFEKAICFQQDVFLAAFPSANTPLPHRSRRCPLTPWYHLLCKHVRTGVHISLEPGVVLPFLNSAVSK